MANNVFQVKRTSTSGRTPNTTSSGNSQYINAGELALNMTDQVLYTSDGTNLITVGSNVANQRVGNLTISAITANGSLGSSGQALTTNGSNVYWSTIVGTNTAAAYVWSNTHTFNANVTLATTASLIANGTPGITGQVLTTNGSSTYWGAGGGGGGALPIRQKFVANGSQNTFTVTGGYYANNLDIYLNGVKLLNTTEANTLSGSTFTILTGNPANGTNIEIVGTSSLTTTGVSTIVNQQITANGTANSFAITNGYIANSIAVFLNGVKQIPGTDVITTSGANVSFAVTPANNYVIDVYGYQTAVSYTSNTLIIGNTNIGLNSITSNGVSDSWFMGNVGIGTNSPVAKLDVSGNTTGGVSSYVRNTNTTVSSYSVFGCYSNNGTEYIQLISYAQSTGYLVFNQTGGGVIITPNAQPIVFSTNNTERMRIAGASGSLLIGSTNDYGKLFVSQAANNSCAFFNLDATANVAGLNCIRANVNLTTQGILDLEYQGVTKGTFSTDGTNITFNTVAASIFSTASTERMRIDSSGNVGIGTSSPSAKLDVQGNGTIARYLGNSGTYQGFAVQSTSANSSNYNGIFYDARNESGAAVANFLADINTDGSSAWVWTTQPAGTRTDRRVERMRIDSSGRVTKPYQPAFFASGSGGTVTMSVGSYIPFNSLNTTFAGSNRNSGFNTSNYLYTAPVAGLYQFYVQLYLSPSSRNNSITWWKNGAQMSYGSDAAQAIYISTNSSTAPDTVVFSGAVIMELAAGDYVGLQVRTTFGNVTMYMGHSSFWGYLVA